MEAEKEHQRQWKFLQNQHQGGQLSHAYLLSGPEEVDKKKFAKAFIQFINCREGKKPCLVCNACQGIERESYPDFTAVKAEPEKEEIEIKQIRDLQNFLSYKAYYEGYKAVIIEDAERMTLEAQNCFLKTLEEPKGRTIIFLLASKPDRLLSTISSRCQQVKFFYTGTYAVRKHEEVLLRDVKKLIASDLAEKFQYAKKANLDGGGLEHLLQVIQTYLRSALLHFIHTGRQQEAAMAKYSVTKLKHLIRLTETLSHQIANTNANKKLALEILLMEL